MLQENPTFTLVEGGLRLAFRTIGSGCEIEHNPHGLTITADGDIYSVVVANRGDGYAIRSDSRFFVPFAIDSSTRSVTATDRAEGYQIFGIASQEGFDFLRIQLATGRDSNGDISAKLYNILTAMDAQDKTMFIALFNIPNRPTLVF